MRELATIRKVDEVNPIDGADKIECLHIGGWKVVSQKGNFAPGDLAVFLEIDSFLPASDVRFEGVFQGKGKRTFDGVEGYRLKTVKLRGQVSQGLALPVGLFPEIAGLEEGADITDTLGVTKYEVHEPATGFQRAKGSFPWFIPKTDQPRVQNLSRGLREAHEGNLFLPTLKLDGSSTTIYYVRDEQYFIKPVEGQTEQVGICSRNLLLDHEADPDNHFVKAVENSGLIDLVTDIGRTLEMNIALQGETIGPGVVRSWEKVAKFQCLVFDIFDIDDQEYFTGEEFEDMIDIFCIPSTLVYEPFYALKHSTDFLLEYAEGPSLINPIREGVVFKQMNGNFSFKAVSNKFLLKGGA